MADLHTLEELRAYLIAQGVVQAQSATPSTVLPSVWLSPRSGAPEPRTGESATVTLIDTLLAPPTGLVAWIEEAFIDIVVRARSVPNARLIHRQIRGLLHPIEAHGGRHGWQMAGLEVEYSTLWRGEQPLPVAEGETTYARTAGYRIAVRRHALAGTP